jgi:foldase protein PrsA
LKKGESFDKLAKELSIDKGSGKRGGDLGFFGRGVMVKAFEVAAFKLEKNQISEPLKTQFGYHIIKRIG